MHACLSCQQVLRFLRGVVAFCVLALASLGTQAAAAHSLLPHAAASAVYDHDLGPHANAVPVYAGAWSDAVDHDDDPCSPEGEAKGRLCCMTAGFGGSALISSPDTMSPFARRSVRTPPLSPATIVGRNIAPPFHPPKHSPLV